jgi:hypothetical protein
VEGLGFEGWGSVVRAQGSFKFRIHWISCETLVRVYGLGCRVCSF